MKVLILLGLVGIALGAVVPVSYQKGQLENVQATKELLLLPAPHPFASAAAIRSDWLSDLIEKILGMKVVQLIILINDTLVGSTVLVESTVQQLQQIMLEVTTDIKVELQEIINEALAEALEIMQPILDQMSKILPVIGSMQILIGKEREMSTQDFVSDLILAILGVTLEEFLTNINDALLQLNTVLNVTLVKLVAVAAKVATSVAVKINEVINSSLNDAQDLVRPLQEMLGQIFPLSRNILEELIEAFLSLDFPGIIAQAKISIIEIDRIGQETLEDLNDVIEAEPIVKAEIERVILDAVITANKILEPLRQILIPLLPFTTPGQVVEKLQSELGIPVEKLIDLLISIAGELNVLLKDTMASLIEIGEGAGADVSAKINLLLTQTLAKIDNSLEPLLGFLKPIFDVLQPVYLVKFASRSDA